MKTLAVIARDVLGFAGMSVIVYGAWLIYQPAGLITAGAFAVIGAVLLSMSDRPAPSPDETEGE